MDTVALRDQLAAHLHQWQEATLASFDAYAHGDFETAVRMNKEASRQQAKATALHHQMRSHAIVWGRNGSVFRYPQLPAVEPSNDPLDGDFH